MHDAPDVQLSVVAATSAGPSGGEPAALQSRGVQRFPPGRGRPSAVEAPAQFGARARQSDLWWERHVNAVLHVRAQ
eukprot:15476789-Alexandrium_andersonii.AAC.1